MYSPKIGRFLQTDPLGYIDTINPYTYCGNNPVNYIDPSGQSLTEAGKKVTPRGEINEQRVIDIRDGSFVPDNLGDWAPSFPPHVRDCVKEGMGTPGVSANIGPPGGILGILSGIKEALESAWDYMKIVIVKDDVKETEDGKKD